MQPGVRECGCCMPWVGFWSGQGLSPCRCDEASDNEGASVRTGVECHMVWVQQGMGRERIKSIWRMQDEFGIIFSSLWVWGFLVTRSVFWGGGGCGRCA